jgi:hypothetical protein
MSQPFFSGRALGNTQTVNEFLPFHLVIPLPGIHLRETSREVHITDIAPTVCQKIHIQQPNACVGEAITEVIE